MTPTPRPSLIAILLLTLSTVAATTSALEPAGTPLSNAAVAHCDAIPDHPEETDRSALDAALMDAERAVAADRNDPKAHFAVFCVLAKLTSLNGFRISSLFDVRRLHREIDAALELFPDYGDALIAKGAFLLHLPRLLGGDTRQAKLLLHRAAVLEPQRISARLYLAEAFDALGRQADARREADYALALALAAGREGQAEKARQLLLKWER